MTGLFLMAVVTAAGAAALAEQKIALVIGNSAYPSAALKNPVNDAKAMAAKLDSLGFEVILRTDASQRDMTRAVSQFGQKLKGGSVGLFYFAGHGMQVRGKNFLIPIDAEIENEASTRSEAVDVDQVLEQLGSARLSMVILDACRNNPFERRFRSAGNGGLAQIDAPTGTLLAYATAPGKVAYDGTGANGLYTTELLKALDTPGLKVEDVFKQVRINVLKASDNQQIPWESSSLTGEFFFKAALAPQNTANDALQAARVQAEVQKAISAEIQRRELETANIKQQSEHERARLARELEEERRRRDQDAEVVRREMETLRKELLAMRQAAPAINDKPQTPVAPPSLPLSSSTPPSVSNSQPMAPAPLDLASKPNAAPASEWNQRLDFLRQSSGSLTYSKAFAILLNVSDAEELSELVRFEKTINSYGYSNALAVGTSAKSAHYWAIAVQIPGEWEARQYAIDQCGKASPKACRVIVSNRQFHEKDFIEFAKSLESFDVHTLRNSLIESIKARPREDRINASGPMIHARLISPYL